MHVSTAKNSEDHIGGAVIKLSTVCPFCTMHKTLSQPEIVYHIGWLLPL